MERQRGRAPPAVLLDHPGRPAEPQGIPDRLGSVRGDSRKRAQPVRQGSVMRGTALEHRLVRDYLTQLDIALGGLPSAKARELRSQIAGHLEEALSPDA